ncbi:MAG TPA: RNA-binding protein [Firmicutes bacterium]|nr:RNA-binding protein [Bacillota bacterium]
MVKTTVTEPCLGQKVRSKQGRDVGNVFLIVEVLSSEYVLVADGQTRTIDRPKKKNRKHLSLTLQVAEEIAAKLTTGDRVTDEEIVDAIRRLGEN